MQTLAGILHGQHRMRRHGAGVEATGRFARHRLLRPHSAGGRLRQQAAVGIETLDARPEAVVRLRVEGEVTARFGSSVPEAQQVSWWNLAHLPVHRACGIRGTAGNVAHQPFIAGREVRFRQIDQNPEAGGERKRTTGLHVVQGLRPWSRAPEGTSVRERFPDQNVIASNLPPAPALGVSDLGSPCHGNLVGKGNLKLQFFLTLNTNDATCLSAAPFARRPMKRLNGMKTRVIFSANPMPVLLTSHVA